MGLAARNLFGFLGRRATPIPYYVIKFKQKKFTSEREQKTLEPEWKSPAFDIGWIAESEMKPLKIKLFDYDVVESDGFMGMICIPGRNLFSYGIGSHTFWSDLRRSKKKEHCKQNVLGKILISIQVEVRLILTIQCLLPCLSVRARLQRKAFSDDVDSSPGLLSLIRPPC